MKAKLSLSTGLNRNSSFQQMIIIEFVQW